jgi:hypothetical protein
MDKLTGLLLAIIGIIITLLAVSPDALSENWNKWIKIPAIQTGLIFILGCLVSVVIFLLYIQKREKQRLSENELFISSDKLDFEFTKLIESGKYNQVLIFGYTGETVFDYIKYSTRYMDTLNIRVLNRDWDCELKDQTIHNSVIDSMKIRHWDKSKSIKHSAKIPWTFAAKRFVKYYKTQPSIKAIILIGQQDYACFISFYHWIKIPITGGSPFKGRSLSMLHLTSGMSKDANNFIEYLISQFEYQWEISHLKNT